MFETASWIRQNAVLLNVTPDQISPASVRLSIGHQIVKMASNFHRATYSLQDGTRFILKPTNLYLLDLSTALKVPDTHVGHLVLLPDIARRGLIMSPTILMPHTDVVNVALHTTVSVEMQPGQPVAEVFFQPLREPLRAQPEALVL